MIKKTITYKDLDGNEITEDFYFALSAEEIAVLELSVEGGFGAQFERIAKAAKPDGAYIMKTFRDLVGQTVGRRSEDNKSFLKNDNIREGFMCSDAYTVLFFELVTDGKKGGEFFKGVMPKDMQVQLEKLERGEITADQMQMTTTPQVQAAEPTTPGPTLLRPAEERKQPAWLTEGRVPTEDELKGATQEELLEAFRRKNAQSGG